jgi:hypothetical protein
MRYSFIRKDIKMTFPKVIASILLVIVAVGNALPQLPSAGNLFGLPPPPPFLPPLPLQRQQLQDPQLDPFDQIYDPFAFQTSETPTRPQEIGDERPIAAQKADQFAIDDSNPPCDQDSQCLCFPEWTFCSANETVSGGQCLLNCSRFCDVGSGCRIKPEVAPTKDLTCHLTQIRIECFQSKSK